MIDTEQLYVAKFKETGKFVAGFRRWVLGEEWWGSASEEHRQYNVNFWLKREGFQTDDLNSADTYRKNDLFYDTAEKYLDIVFLPVELRIS